MELVVPDEERNLIPRLKAGDLEAFEKILFFYEKRIFNYFRRLTGSRDDAADLTQETFIKLYRHRGSIDTRKNFKSWIYAIATNNFYDWLRRQHRRREIPLENGEVETIAADAAYYSIEEDLAAVEDIEAGLQKLKPVYRSVLLLFYKEGFEYQEIAKISALPLNTVKTYIYRAKRALKEILGEDYYG